MFLTLASGLKNARRTHDSVVQFFRSPIYSYKHLVLRNAVLGLSESTVSCFPSIRRLVYKRAIKPS